MAVICVRATFDLSADGALKLAEQQEIILNDIYEGDPHRTPLLRVGDLIPFKPAADVTVLGNAYAPGGHAASSWRVGVSVGTHETWLRIHGPREWEPTLRYLKPTWKLGAAEAVTKVPLDYRLAAGGRFVGDPEGTYHLDNPIGPGILHADWSRVGKSLRAPQIDTIDAPVSQPFEAPRPQGFGPVPPFWFSRERHLGTRDETWQRERMPQMPADLSYRFFQTAPAALTFAKLIGNEAVRLTGLTPGGGTLAFDLPNQVPVARHKWFDGRAVTARLTLDGLHIDLRAETAPWRVDMTWRGWILQCPAYQGSHISVIPTAQAVEMPWSSELGLADEITQA